LERSLELKPGEVTSVKYRINGYSRAGQIFDSWTFTGYGSVESSTMGLKGTNALKAATGLAMRDAAAKLAAEFREQAIVRGLLPANAPLTPVVPPAGNGSAPASGTPAAAGESVPTPTGKSVPVPAGETVPAPAGQTTPATSPPSQPAPSSEPHPAPPAEQGTPLADGARATTADRYGFVGGAGVAVSSGLLGFSIGS